MGDGGDGGIVLRRTHAHRAGAHIDRQVPDDQLCLRIRVLSDNHPGAPGEEVGVGGTGARTLPARHRVGADVPARLGTRPGPDFVDDAFLDGGDVSDHGTGVGAQLCDDDVGGHVGRRGYDDDLWLGAVLAVKRSRAHVSGQGQGGGRGVGELDLDTRRPQRQGERGAQQSRTDDEHRAARGH